MLLFNPEDFGEEAAAALALHIKKQMDIAEAKKLQEKMDALRLEGTWNKPNKSPNYYDVPNPSYSDNYNTWYEKKQMLDDLKDTKYKGPPQIPVPATPKDLNSDYNPATYDNIEAIVDDYPSIRLKNVTNNDLLMKDILIIAGRYEVTGFTKKTMIIDPTKKILFIRELRTRCELWGMPLSLYDAKWISEKWHFIKELIATRHTCPLPPDTNNTAFRYHARTYYSWNSVIAQKFYDHQSGINK